MTTRASYHHGDLRAALVEAGVSLARTGGPDAVGLRAAARAVGVSGTAAYRHFADQGELVDVVQGQALAMLAGRMQDALALLSRRGDPARRALRRLDSLGRSYVEFARAEPGLWRTAFRPGYGGAPTAGEDAAYQLLVDAVAEVGAVAHFSARRQEAARILAWSAVHGVAALLVDGPLAQSAAAEQQRAIDDVIAGVTAGLHP